jgi:hypothetical protein
MLSDTGDLLLARFPAEVRFKASFQGMHGVLGSQIYGRCIYKQAMYLGGRANAPLMAERHAKSSNSLHSPTASALQLALQG